MAVGGETHATAATEVPGLLLLTSTILSAISAILVVPSWLAESTNCTDVGILCNHNIDPTASSANDFIRRKSCVGSWSPSSISVSNFLICFSLESENAATSCVLSDSYFLSAGRLVIRCDTCCRTVDLFVLCFYGKKCFILKIYFTAIFYRSIRYLG